MKEVSLIESVPWLRAVVSLAGGIGLAEYFLNHIGEDGMPVGFSTLLLTGLGCMFVLCVVMAVVHLRLRTIWAPRLFGFLLTLFWLVLGMVVNTVSRVRYTAVWPDECVAVRAVVTDMPRRSERSVSCEAILLDVIGKEQVYRGDRRVQLFLQPSDSALSLRPGDGLLFVAEIRAPANRGNPYEFDYETYLRRKSVTGVVTWLPSGQWVRQTLDLSLRERIPFGQRLRIRALQTRALLVDRYRASGLPDEELAVVAALTLGDKSALTREMRTVYSQVGASHLLALSGLHLGVLLVLLDLFLLRRLRYGRWYFLGALSALAFIWAYVLLAGMPASLVRAATMYSLLLVATALGHRTLSLNLLCLAAFLMLLLHPGYLFDVGFQLSCAAMIALLTIAPRLQRLLPVRSRWLRPLWQTFVAGVAAQIGTAPLVAYYFHLFTPWAPIVGIPAVPLTMLIVALSPLLWLTEWLFPLWTAPAVGVATLVRLQNQGLSWAATWPASRWEHLYPTPWMVATLYALVLLWLYYRPSVSRLRRFIVCGLVVLLFEGQFIYNRFGHREAPCLWFYSLSSCPLAHAVYSPSRSYLLTPSPDSIASRARYVKEAYWERSLTHPPRTVDLERWEALEGKAAEGIVRLPGLTLALLHDDRWRRQHLVSPVRTDYLYVTSGFRGKLTDLRKSFLVRTVVLDASLGRQRAARYCEECKALGWQCHDLRTQGALRVALK